ncbi:hypothetical protein HMPREF1145_1208 [Oribacterium parvum ACB8]|nr:hypothetical protein HMPREF1145_1208 [Oribacterium parvum ACB8]
MLRFKNPPSHNIGLKSGQTLSPLFQTGMRYNKRDIARFASDTRYELEY